MNEADLKLAVSEYLQYGTNQGKWYADRLNSGSLLTQRGQSTYRVNLCKEGTADFMVLQYYRKIGSITIGQLRTIFLELKGDKGKQRPEQAIFQKLVEMQGAEYYIIRSIERLEKVLA